MGQVESRRDDSIRAASRRKFRSRAAGYGRTVAPANPRERNCRLAPGARPPHAGWRLRDRIEPGLAATGCRPNRPRGSGRHQVLPAVVGRPECLGVPEEPRRPRCAARAGPAAPYALRGRWACSNDGRRACRHRGSGRRRVPLAGLRQARDAHLPEADLAAGGHGHRCQRPSGRLGLCTYRGPPTSFRRIPNQGRCRSSTTPTHATPARRRASCSLLPSPRTPRSGRCRRSTQTRRARSRRNLSTSARFSARKPRRWTGSTPVLDDVRVFEFTYRWLAAFFRQREPRETVCVIVGDHQPMSAVTGDSASWDAPMHTVSRDPVLIERLVALGSHPGMERPVARRECLACPDRAAAVPLCAPAAGDRRLSRCEAGEALRSLSAGHAPWRVGPSTDPSSPLATAVQPVLRLCVDAQTRTAPNGIAPLRRRDLILNPDLLGASP